MNYIPTPAPIVNPGWTVRNQEISKFILPNTKVLDLGCGSKDLLRYISPSKYHGIDYNSKFADSTVNFNENFSIPDSWDYIVCSGVLEYLNNLKDFFSKISNHSEYYIFTYWTVAKRGINNPSALELYEFNNILKNHFIVINEGHWNDHIIKVCKDIG